MPACTVRNGGCQMGSTWDTPGFQLAPHCGGCHIRCKCFFSSWQYGPNSKPVSGYFTHVEQPRCLTHLYCCICRSILGALAGGAVAVAAAPVAAAALGMGAGGIAAGGAGAYLMGLYGAAVPAGGLVATLQSVGAAGLGYKTAVAAASAGAKVGSKIGSIYDD